MHDLTDDDRIRLEVTARRCDHSARGARRADRGIEAEAYDDDARFLRKLVQSSPTPPSLESDEIQRWTHFWSPLTYECKKDDDGLWVKYEDHRRKLAEHSSGDQVPGITDEMVEAAAKAIFVTRHPSPPDPHGHLFSLSKTDRRWRDIGELRRPYIHDAEVALRAALSDSTEGR